MNPYYLQFSGPVMGQHVAPGFVTGFVAAGCLSAFQEGAMPASRQQLQRVLRRALQAGTAVAAGQHAAAALHRGDYSRALMAAAAGATGVLVIERLLCERAATDLEKSDGKEA